MEKKFRLAALQKRGKRGKNRGRGKEEKKEREK